MRGGALLALAVACAMLAAALARATAASADVFAPIALVSASPSEQVQYAHDPVISADGRYVAFDGFFAGSTGVWRRDLQSGAIEAVAVGEPGTPAGDAELPSISSDGRFVSFTTTARLDPQNDLNAGPDVYVRDMENHDGEPCLAATEAMPSPPPCAYTLASAADGQAQGLTYAYGSNPSFEATHNGSLAAGRSALSADGRRVAFVTTAVSNLADPATTATPALQVAVRDLDRQTTQLVSERFDPATGAPVVNGTSGRGEPVSGVEGVETYGAVYTGQGGKPPSFADPLAYGITAPVGASLSADGSTVAWMGVDVAEQSRTLPAESLAPKYTEPLWRRIADGPQAPIRRVTGGSDPANPACAASGELAVPAHASAADPCQGPFATLEEPVTPGVWQGGEGDVIPRLSADGYAVALLANAPLVAAGANFGQGGENRHSDAYLVDMHDGLTRLQALRPLTELASGNQVDLATTGPIVDVAVSPGGGEAAFTTKRTQFPLGSPAYVSAPAAIAGMLELFNVDLANDTLTRVTGGFEGGASEHPHETKLPGEDPYTHPYDGALSPSYTADGNTLAFSSTASNLVYGDGNTPQAKDERFDGSDAFVVSRVLFAAGSVSQFLSPAPAGPSPAPLWRLWITALSRRDGSVLLEVAVPAAGGLHAQASATVVVRGARRASKGKGARHGSSKRRRARASVATRSVSSRDAHPAGAGVVGVVLKLASSYARLATARGGLSAMATVTFKLSGRPTLRASVPITFIRTVKSRRAKRHSSKRARRR